MVRLKLVVTNAAPVYLVGFNTTMVRLKPKQEVKAQFVVTFQYHYGSINAERRGRRPVVGFLFQYHYGSINANYRLQSGSPEGWVSIPLWFD